MFAFLHVGLALSCLTARVTGGWRDETRPRNGQNSNSRKSHFDGANPAVRVHAVLGGFYIRSTATTC
jgi:hypothetical protein